MNGSTNKKPNDSNAMIDHDTQKTYNHIAPHFAKTRKRSWPEMPHILNAITTYNPEATTILDLGCGDGRLIDTMNTHFASPFIHYTGVDYAQEFVNAASQNHPYAQFACDDMIGYLEKQSQESIDVIITLASFQHLPSDHARQYCLHLIHRALTYGGIHISINRCLSSRFVQKYWTTIARSRAKSLISLGYHNPWTLSIPYTDHTTTYPRTYHIIDRTHYSILQQYSGMTVHQATYIGRDGQLDASWTQRRNSFLVSQKILH